MPTYKFENIDKLEITVPSDDDDAAKQRQKRGPIKPRSQDELLFRKKGKFINFYDLGQVWNGSQFVDLVFNVDTGLTITHSPPTGGGEIFTLPQFNLETHWQALFDAILAVAPEQWKTKYRKLEYAEAEKYGLTYFTSTYKLLKTGNPDWTAAGLKPPGAGIWVLNSTLFMEFDTANTADFKITASPSYSAPEIDRASFSLADGADIFLVPVPLYPNASNAGGTDPPQSYIANFICGWALPSRKVLLNKTHYAHDPDNFAIQSEQPMFSGSGGSGSTNPDMLYNPLVFDRIATTFKNDLYTWFKSLPHARFHVGRKTSGVWSWSDEPLSNFPIIDLSPSYFENVTFFTEAFDSGFDPHGDYIYNGPGILRAVVKKGTDFYYVWNKVNKQAGIGPLESFRVYEYAP